jgi:hypothetical protein
MEFTPDLYVGIALFKMSGLSFDVHTEVATGQAETRTIETFDADPQVIEVGHRKWYGHFTLVDGKERADFDAALAQAMIGAHDVEIQLPTGEQARIDIDGESFTGLGQWPLD